MVGQLRIIAGRVRLERSHSPLPQLPRPLLLPGSQAAVGAMVPSFSRYRCASGGAQLRRLR